MKAKRLMVNVSRVIGMALVGASMSACAATSWKEEVLLHDGSKVIVERSQLREGRHEIGQGPPIKEHSITFTPPGSNKPVTWKDEFSADIGHASFHLIMLDFLNGVPYIVTTPSNNLAYNKWGRPNPPYVFFRYVEQQWKRIPLQEFPVEFERPNVILNPGADEDAIKSEGRKLGFISASRIKELNSSIRQAEYQTILRTPIDYGPPRAGTNTGELIRTEDGWASPDMVELKKKVEERLKAQREAGGSKGTDK